MTDEVPVCPDPDCDSARIRRRSGDVIDEDWYCRVCKQRFDKPDYRETRGNRVINRGLAARLDDDLEPGDLVTDGGYVDGPESYLEPDANQCFAKGCTRTITLVPGCDTLCEPHREDPPNGFETIEGDADHPSPTDTDSDAEEGER
jgi:hypothetical protein